MDKNYKIIKLSLLGVLLALLIAILIYGINNKHFNIGFSYGNDNCKDCIELDGEELNLKDIENIDVGWINGTIKISKEDIDHIKITEKSKDAKNKMKYKIENKNLVLVSNENKNMFGFGIKQSKIKDLTIHVPKKYYLNNISISGVALNVDIEDIDVNKINIENVNGDIDVDANAKKLEIQTMSSNMNVNGKINDLDVEAVTGNVNASLLNNNYDIDVENMSGDIVIKVDENYGFKADLEGFSGDRKIGFEGIFNDKDEFEYKTGENSIDIETMSGNISILSN